MPPVLHAIALDAPAGQDNRMHRLFFGLVAWLLVPLVRPLAAEDPVELPEIFPDLG